MKFSVAIAALAAMAAVSAPASAQDAWQFRLTPYIWAAGLKGDVGTIPGQPAVPVDVSSHQALEDLASGGMFSFDARKGRHGFLVDVLYTDVRSDFELLPAPIGLEMKAISKTTIASLAYQYEWYREDQTVVDLLAGARYWKVASTLEFSGGLGLLAGKRIDNSFSWTDPGVGIKARAPLGGGKFYVDGGAAVGGFGVGSKHFYDLNANVGYQWSKAIGTTVGYRMFDVNYEDGGYVYDVRQQGWQFALSWSF